MVEPLHNGIKIKLPAIVLRDRQPALFAPMRGHCLATPPKVILIDGGRRLFVDDALPPTCRRYE